MTKPIIEDTRWAVTTLGVESTTQSDPDGTLKDDGYQDDDIPDPRDWNWWHRHAHKWFQYLDSGNLDGDHTVSGSLTVGDQLFSFTNFTFTADHTTGRLSATANPLVTGDGPIRPGNVGGALPTGLSSGTDYWWIRIDANTGQVALSKSDALLGIFVSFSTDGSGTNTIIHQSGTTRATDASVSRHLTVGGQVVQNHQWETLPIFPQGTPVVDFELTLPAAAVAQPNPSNSPNGFTVQIPSIVGRKITGVRARVADDTVTRLVVLLEILNQTSTIGSPPLVAASDVSGTQSTSTTGSGQLEVISKTGFSETVVENASYFVCVRVTTNSDPTGCRVFALEYRWV